MRANRFRRCVKPAAAAALCAALVSGCAGYLIGPERELSPARAAVVAAASAQIGAPYRYGGNDLKGFDDAGLVHFAYAQAGFAIPRFRKGQLRAGEPIGFDAAKPGDLLFYRLAFGSAPPRLHVGLYLGNGEMVHAVVDRDAVSLAKVDSAFWRERFETAVQILP